MEMKQLKLLNSFTNLLSGVGGERAKSSYSAYTRTNYTPQQLMDMYETTWLGGKGVSIVVDDMLSGMRTIDGKEPDIDNEFDIVESLRESLTYLRVLGGAAIHFDTGAEDTSQPLLDGESLLKLVVFRPDVLKPKSDTNVITDLRSEWYGLPELFEYSNGVKSNVYVHVSRLHIFPKRQAFRGMTSTDFWRPGVLHKAYEHIVRAGSISAMVEDIVHEKNVDTFKIEDLMSMCSTDEGTTALLKRFAINAQSKSLYNAQLIDATEEYISTERSLVGVIEALKDSMNMISAAFNVPVTRMFGSSPGGLNATGESDIQNYFQDIEAQKLSVIKPFIKRFDTLTNNSIDEISFRKSRVLNDKDKGDHHLKTAQVAEKIALLLTPEIAARYLSDNINLSLSDNELQIITESIVVETE